MAQTSLESAFAAVKSLVEDFDAGKDHYLSARYSEAEVRKAFIDKFFVALGWDVNHETDKNPYEQEVHIELNVDVQGRKKRADYAFYFKPNFRDVMFYVEAKKPSGQLANEDDYFQTIRYGYNSQTAIAVLTDFAEFHILDCRYAPSVETALDRFVKRYTYQDYLNKEKFAEIYYLFSREAVAAGSIEKRALELPKARGGAVQLGQLKGAYKPIDATLLDELDQFRDKLAHAFKNGRSDLDHWELTEIVQRTIDRLVFLRFLEDKLIEPEEIISTFGAKSDSPWKDFVSTCRKLDKIYNGTIYKKHGILDAADFAFNENVFADICEQLSNKNTPYDFNSIPIHILGSIYERFLGKVITTTAKRAVVEEKPEVKKAGGVFYTPEYIVRYIVENTIGKLIDGKNPQEIASMRFADIACGSGSFLIGAYDYLLRYHASFFNQNPEKANQRDCVEREAGLFLSLHKKREILLNNIYGVDIDQQAVGVAQLSLYLKLLENETIGSTAVDRRSEDKETVLPALGKNIQCGNSLVETDFEEGHQIGLFDKEYERTVNMFNWKDNFPEVMKAGGFDAVIGNPPYVRQEMLGEFKEYYQQHYKVYHSAADLYVYFLERGVGLLRDAGLFSIIVANKWLRTSYGEPLRKWMKQRAIKEIVDFGDQQVFHGATTYPCIVTLSRTKPKARTRICKVSTLTFAQLGSYIDHHAYYVSQEGFENGGWGLTDESTDAVLGKLKSNGIPLSSYVQNKVYYGIKTGLNDAFVIDEQTRARLVKEHRSSSVLIKPFSPGKEIKRYQTIPDSDYIILIPKGWTNQHRKSENPWKWFESSYPALAGHLKGFSTAAQKRCDKGDYWWELRACDYYDVFEKPKIIYPNICKQPEFTFDESGRYANQKTFIIGFDDKYLLGVLNSSLCNFLFKAYLPKLRGGFYEPSYVYFKDFPIHRIDATSAKERGLRVKIVALVDGLLQMNAGTSTAKSDYDRNSLARKIGAAARQIDELVYELYGLTAEEIKIVEESFESKAA